MSEPAVESEPLPRSAPRRKRARKASHLLRVYRHVFKTHAPKHPNGKPKKEDPNIALIRDIKEQQPAKFVEKMQQLEAEYAAMRGGESPETVQMDEGSRKVLDLVEQLLDDLSAKRTQTPKPRPALKPDRSEE